MGSFWKTSAGEEATGKVEETSGFAPIPREWYKSMFEEATVREWEGVKSVNLKTRVIGEGPFKNRVVFLKLKCWDEEDKKRDAAIQKATKISDTLGVKQPTHEPDDAYFSQWVDKPLDLLIDTFIPKDGSRPDGYPYLVNIDTKGAQSGVKAGSDPAKGAPKKAAPSREPGDDIDSVDIPF